MTEREREALMRLTMCAREECSMCKYQDDCNFGFQYELATENMNILADALHKTEPNNSEKLNNCDTCRNKGSEGCEQPCLGCGCCGLYEPKDEPTISKMEQVDKDINVRSKDEPQTEKGGCTNCDGKDLCNNAFTEISQYCGAYEPQNGYQTFNGTSVYVSRLEDEPQYETGMGTLKCDNCSEYGSFKCTKCDGEMYFKRLEPKDESQTERSE